MLTPEGSFKVYFSLWYSYLWFLVLEVVLVVLDMVLVVLVG